MKSVALSLCALLTTKSPAALKDYKPVTTEPEPNDPTLDLNGLTDDTGNVIDLSGTKQPTFCPKFLSTYKSWANLAFAFYFDDSASCLSISVNDISEGSIEHPRDRCVKKQSPGYRQPWVCPNDIVTAENPAPI